MTTKPKTETHRDRILRFAEMENIQATNARQAAKAIAAQAGCSEPGCYQTLLKMVAEDLVGFDMRKV